MKTEIDIDGVIRNFTGKLEEVYLRENPTHKILRRDVYDLAHWFPIGKEIYKFAYEIHATEIYTKASLYPGGKNFLTKLAKMSEVIFVTHQPNKNLEYLTLEWIYKNELPHHDVIFTKDKSNFKGDYLLDDYTENLKRVDEMKSSRPICFNQPWNQDWKGQRVKSYNEFLEIINLNNKKIK